LSRFRLCVEFCAKAEIAALCLLFGKNPLILRTKNCIS